MFIQAGGELGRASADFARALSPWPHLPDFSGWHYDPLAYLPRGGTAWEVHVSSDSFLVHLSCFLLEALLFITKQSSGASPGRSLLFIFRCDLEKPRVPP